MDVFIYGVIFRHVLYALKSTTNYHEILYSVPSTLIAIKRNLFRSLSRLHAVAQLIEALRYKPAGRGFDSRWCHRNFSLT